MSLGGKRTRSREEIEKRQELKEEKEEYHRPAKNRGEYKSVWAMVE